MGLPPDFSVPANCGKRLLPAVFDETAANEPQRTFISVPKSSNLSDGFKDINYVTFGKAVDKYAHWLRVQLGESVEPKTILYFGPLDIRYLLVILDTPKAGHIPFFGSHRNSLEAHQSIAEKAGCETILAPEGAPAILGQMFKTLPLKQIPIPSLSYFFKNLDKVEHIPYTLTHTCQLSKGHVRCPPPEPLTADMMNLVYKYAKLDGALLAPPLIVDSYNNPEYYETMISNLKFLSYVGGALPKEVGMEVTKRIKLTTLMGSCETALHPPEINEDPADWQCLTLSEFLGCTFVEHKAGHHELVIKRDLERELFQGVFSTFPDKQEFHSGDLFEQHPTRPQSWIFRARTDDIIAFTTAEKLSPVTMESTISTNPKIKSALIGGQGKFQASLLIEPHVYPQSAEEEEQLIKDIWPSVLQANRACPSHGRIMKGFVMLATADKPIPRAGKGTVQRHTALELYKCEFEALYGRPAPAPATPTVQNGFIDDIDERIEKALTKILPGMVETAIQKAFSQMLLGLSGAGPAPRLPNGVRDSTQQIRSMIYAELAENLDIAQISDDTDLFNAGLDSLQVQSLLNIINGYLAKSRPGVEPLNVKKRVREADWKGNHVFD
ncbi:hypothetical protein GQ44DRAFT_732474 [Phaeosphaeriaceae sp. PMI808]|nr:hypothetical protein GQ44DRAFT_732474 [Phaeosphaeriaceae sp. PMI808]